MIPIVDLSPKIALNEAVLTSVFAKVIKSNRYILGEEVSGFETEFAQYLGANYCVGVASGTDALELGLKSFNLPNGSLVGAVANAGAYSTNAILTANLTPFMMDVDLETKVITLAEVTKAIKNGVQAIIATHLYGLLIPQILEIAEICKKNKVLLLEDCSQCHGARDGDKFAGTFGNAGVFSFYPTKNLGALGDGGCIVSNDENIYRYVKILRQYGWVEKYDVRSLNGINSRLDELQAAILRIFLPQLDDCNNKRHLIASRYRQEIKNVHITLPSHNFEKNFVAHLFVIRSSHRDQLKKFLTNNGVSSEIHYPILDYRQAAYNKVFHDITLENSEILAAEVLSIPCFPDMTEAQVSTVIAALNNWVPLSS